MTVSRQYGANRVRDFIKQLRTVDVFRPKFQDTPLDRLSPGERQLVEVARALQLDAEIIIFDEPTTSLTARETERLFWLIRRLREAGKATEVVAVSLG